MIDSLEVKTKTITSLLSLTPQLIAPAVAQVGDLYSYQSATQIALCLYSPAYTWITVGGTAVCP